MRSVLGDVVLNLTLCSADELPLPPSQLADRTSGKFVDMLLQALDEFQEKHNVKLKTITKIL